MRHVACAAISRGRYVLTCRDFGFVGIQQLHVELAIWLTLQSEAVVFMQHHVGVGMVDSV